jgi:hypothetical protein
MRKEVAGDARLQDDVVSAPVQREWTQVREPVGNEHDHRDRLPLIRVDERRKHVDTFEERRRDEESWRARVPVAGSDLPPGGLVDDEALADQERADAGAYRAVLVHDQRADRVLLPCP